MICRMCTRWVEIGSTYTHNPKSQIHVWRNWTETASARHFILNYTFATSLLILVSQSRFLQMGILPMEIQAAVCTFEYFSLSIAVWLLQKLFFQTEITTFESVTQWVQAARFTPSLPSVHDPFVTTVLTWQEMWVCEVKGWCLSLCVRLCAWVLACMHVWRACVYVYASTTPPAFSPPHPPLHRTQTGVKAKPVDWKGICSCSSSSSSSFSCQQVRLSLSYALTYSLSPLSTSVTFWFSAKRNVAFFFHSHDTVFMHTKHITWQSSYPNWTTTQRAITWVPEKVEKSWMYEWYVMYHLEQRNSLWTVKQRTDTHVNTCIRTHNNTHSNTSIHT